MGREAPVLVGELRPARCSSAGGASAVETRERAALYLQREEMGGLCGVSGREDCEPRYTGLRVPSPDPRSLRMNRACLISGLVWLGVFFCWRVGIGEELQKQ